MRRGVQARLARDLLGVPLLPPGRATRVVERTRAALVGLHRRLAPAPIRILEALGGLADNRALGLLVELDVPDRLDRPMAADELAALVDADPDALDRLLRYAAARGFVACRAGRYHRNGVTDLLRRDHPNRWRGWVELAGSDWWWDAWRHADAPVRGVAPSGLEAATGSPFFAFVHADRPDAGRAFDDAMAAGGRLQGLALAAGLDWDEVATVCDIGGGTGAALGSLLAVHPHLRGTLLDLPAVVARADVPEGCEVVPGDAFTAVPPGLDRYLLLAIVHDWSDDEATALLTTIARATPDHGRVVVVERPLTPTPTDAFETATDLQMLVVSTGRERTVAAYEALFAAAGLAIEAAPILASGATAMVLRRR